MTRVLGPAADLTTARRYVRQALGRNSTATLELARRHAESAIHDAVMSRLRPPLEPRGPGW